MLSRERDGYPLPMIVKHTMGHYSSISVGIRRLKQRLLKDLAAVKKVKEIEDRLGMV